MKAGCSVSNASTLCFGRCQTSATGTRQYLIAPAEPAYSDRSQTLSDNRIKDYGKGMHGTNRIRLRASLFERRHSSAEILVRAAKGEVLAFECGDTCAGSRREALMFGEGNLSAGSRDSLAFPARRHLCCRKVQFIGKKCLTTVYIAYILLISNMYSLRTNQNSINAVGLSV